MSELSKVYEPESVEKKWYQKWEESGLFHGTIDSEKQAYSIVIPPPNVTGVLHIGHILNNTIQDILARKARQMGKSVLWLPGTDHAGIATQTRVEKELRKQGQTKHQIGREAFLRKIHQWREKHGGIILKQLRKLGASCDWERTQFTLDPKYSQAVIKAFVSLYNKGYIYKGKRMVNWCPASQTALSDEEVITKSQNSILYKIRYQVVEEPGRFLEIATTRPETLMGDTAIAIHPEDQRWSSLRGKHCWRPFPREAIPIIADKKVEKDFGTGILKVTPAHDKADWEMGQRHKLPLITIINADGSLNNNAGAEFSGLDRFKARKEVAKKLRSMGLLVEEKPYQNQVGFSERSDVPIEPRLSEQWFLKYPKVDEAKAVVSGGNIQFYPPRWTKTYLHWLENIQDWCISRQLWWGHRIPVWYRKNQDRSSPENWHVSEKPPEDSENWEQDNDVLDTWASSWLWPFATMGWSGEEDRSPPELDYWYPTSILVTGPDIIFFWVARMIMAGLEFTKEKIPFHKVYFTGIIRDQQGRKMSKSLGNSPDPLDLISKFGADGLRFGIMSIAPQGQDVLFSEERVQQGRNFCNKLWNACRFRQMSGSSYPKNQPQEIINRMNLDYFDDNDHAILANLKQTLQENENHLEQYQFNQALQCIYSFFWHDFCDWYLEVSKEKIQDSKLKENCLAIQDWCIRQVLLLLHPFIPFITEELWMTLQFAKNPNDSIQKNDVISIEEWEVHFNSDSLSLNLESVKYIQKIREFVTQARALKTQYKMQNRKDIGFFIEDKEQISWKKEKKLLLRIIGAKSIDMVTSTPHKAPATVTPLGTLYLNLHSGINIDAEIKRLEKQKKQLTEILLKSEAKLNNPKFLKNAPDKILLGAKKQILETRQKHREIIRLLEQLS